MQAGELPGQGNDGGREAVEGREDQVGRGMRGDGCVGAGRAERESADGFVRVDDGCRWGTKRPDRVEFGRVWATCAAQMHRPRKPTCACRLESRLPSGVLASRQSVPTLTCFAHDSNTKAPMFSCDTRTDAPRVTARRSKENGSGGASDRPQGTSHFPCS